MTTESRAVDDRLLQKLRRLVETERSKRAAGEGGDVASLNEAEAFATAIQRLLLQHNLSMSDVEFVAHRKGEIGPELWDPTEAGAKVLQRRSPWREELAVVVAHAHLCRVLVFDNTNQVLFVGHTADRECAVYAYTMLVRFAEKFSRYETRKKRRELRKTEGTAKAAYGWRDAWLRGFNLRIATRYREAEQAAKRQASDLDALVPFQHRPAGLALVRRLDDVRQDVKAWVDEHASDEKADDLKRTPAAQLNRDALAAGYEAGGRAPLGVRGLTGTPPPEPLPRGAA